MGTVAERFAVLYTFYIFRCSGRWEKDCWRQAWTTEQEPASKHKQNKVINEQITNEICICQ